MTHFHTKLLTFISLTQIITAQLPNSDIDQLIQQHSHNVLTIPQFSGQFFTLTPQTTEVINSDQLVVQDIDTVWDIEKFKRPRVPAKIAKVENQEAFTKPGVPRCIHFPIKFPNSDIRIPQEYEQFAESLQKIFDYEYSANPHFDKYYAYLTVDQGFIPRESTQRVPGPHVDGIPRDRENPQTVIDHAYLVTNAVPTRFYSQPLDMTKYDLNKHHFFAIFRALIDETQSFTLKPFEINLMNAYSIHTPEVAQEDVHRTIMRLEFSVLDFDREGNSINPAFADDDHFPNYPFKYIPRPIPKELTIPVDIFQSQPISSKVYTLSDFDRFGRERLLKQLRDNPRKSTQYHNLETIYHQIESGDLNGFVAVYEHVVQGFAVYNETDSKLNINVLYTHSKGADKELMIWMLNTLKTIAGKKILVFVEDQNNIDMIQHFERAANLANIPYLIEKAK